MTEQQAIELARALFSYRTRDIQHCDIFLKCIRCMDPSINLGAIGMGLNYNAGGDCPVMTERRKFAKFLKDWADALSGNCVNTHNLVFITNCVFSKGAFSADRHCTFPNNINTVVPRYYCFKNTSDAIESDEATVTPIKDGYLAARRVQDHGSMISVYLPNGDSIVMPSQYVIARQNIIF